MSSQFILVFIFASNLQIMVAQNTQSTDNSTSTSQMKKPEELKFGSQTCLAIGIIFLTVILTVAMIGAFVSPLECKIVDLT